MCIVEWWNGVKIMLIGLFGVLPSAALFAYYLCCERRNTKKQIEEMAKYRYGSSFATAEAEGARGI